MSITSRPLDFQRTDCAAAGDAAQLSLRSIAWRRGAYWLNKLVARWQALQVREGRKIRPTMLASAV